MRKLLLALLLLAAGPTSAAVTYFGTAGSPADNSAQDDVAITITPPASMQAGDLPYVECTSMVQSPSYDISVTTTGGQTWTSGTVQSNDATYKTLKIFYVLAFTGTWGANPVFTPSSTGTFSTFSCRMLVFRGSSTSVTWSVDQAAQYATYTAPGSPFTMTRAGQTVTGSSGVTIASFTALGGLPTFSSLTGGWANPGGTTQFRNSYNSDLVTGFAYKLITSSGATGSVSMNQSATGYAGRTSVITFAESGGAPPTFSVAPAIGTRTTSSIPVTATTACTDCSYYGVAVTDGSGAPTCTQVKAGQNSSGSAAYKAFGPVSMTSTVQNTGTFSTYTDGTIRDGYFCLNSTASGDSSVSSIADMYKVPAFSVTPFVSARSSTTHTVQFTLDGAGTVYVAGCLKDSASATTTQTEAGNCTGNVTARAANSKSVVASSDTVVITYGTPLLVYDVNVVGTYGSQHMAAPVALTDEIAGAAAGYTAPAALASICSDAPCPVKVYNDANATDIAIGDYFSASSATSPDAFAITWGTDGNFSYTGTAARQTFNFKAYDVSAAGMLAGANPALFYVNNSVPVCSSPSPTQYAPFTAAYKQGIAATPFNVTGFCTDADNDVLTFAVTTGTLNPGLSLSTDGVITGTPTTESESGTSIGITATDVAGDSASFDILIGVANTVAVPNCASMLAAACVSAIQTPGWLTANVLYDYSDTVAIGYVISTTPVAATEAQPFSSVDVLVSLGVQSTLGTLESFYPIELAEKLPWLRSYTGLRAAAAAEAASARVWAKRNALNKLRINPLRVPGHPRPVLPAP